MTEKAVSPVAARIFIVEDDGIIALRLQHMLTDLGYEVTGAVSTGERALERIMEDPPDLILMDIKLAGDWDGIETAARIRARLDIPIIYLSAYSEQMVMDEIRHTQPAGFLAKPVREKELGATIEMALYKHRMETQLRESEARYRLLAENVEDVIWQLNETLDSFTYISPSATRLLGYTPEELMAMPITASLASTFRAYPPQVIARLLAAEKQGQGDDMPRVWEAECTRKDGTTLWVESTLRPLRDTDGTFRGLVGVARDITARKHAEKARRKSEERLALTLQAAELGVWDWNVPTGEVVFNERWAEMLGYTLDEIEPHVDTWEKLMHPEEVPDVMATLNAHLEGRTPLYQAEHRLRTKSGAWRWILDTGKVFERDAQGNPLRVVGTHQDITERKQAEQALRESEARFRLAVLHSGITFAQTDRDLRYTWISNPHPDFAPQSALGKRDDELDNNEGTRRLIALKRRVLETGHKLREDIAFPVSDGPRIYNVLAEAMRDGDEQVIGVATCAMDITARKKAEKALQTSELRFRSFVEQSAAGIVLTDPEGMIVEWNQAEAELSGIPRDEALGTPIWEVLSRWAPDAEKSPHLAERLREMILPGLRTGQAPWLNTWTTRRLQRPDGTQRYVTTIMFSIAVEDGYAIGSITRDITERKKAEEALQAATERLQILHEIDAAILAAQSAEDIARAALAHLHDLIPYHVASVSEVDLEQQQGRDVVVLIHGEPMEVSTSAWKPLSKGGKIADIAHRDHTYLVQDLATLETPSPLEQYLDSIGGRAYVSVPMIAQGKVAGRLNVAVDTPNFFQPGHIEILEEISDSLAIAMQQANLLAQTQQDAEAKTLLLHDVNHRVMNNLEMIRSILELEMGQPRSYDNEESVLQTVLQDISNRIQGIATVHRMLSGVQEDALDPDQVISKVIHAALSGAMFRENIAVTVNSLNDLPAIPSKQAVTLALVINELTTNSIKYAFADRSQGALQVQVERLDAEDGAHKLRLEFRDDGPGWPEDVLTGERYSMGLWLIQANVTHTLGGEITWRTDGGAVVEIQFPVRYRYGG